MPGIDIHKAHLHNLQDISVTFPLHTFTVVTGVSGSGKSTLVFDVLFESCRRRYLESLGVLTPQTTAQGYQRISGLRPAIAVSQSLIRQTNPRSVVGTRAGVLPLLAAVFADSHNRANRSTSPDASTPPLTSSHFLFNSPQGMCFECNGRGHRLALDFSVLLPESSTTLPELYDNCGSRSSFNYMLKKLPKLFDVDLEDPFEQFPEAAKEYVLYGSHRAGKPTLSLINRLEHKLRQGKDINNALIKSTCTDCNGFRVAETARAVKIGGCHIGELANLPLGDLQLFLNDLNATTEKRKSASGKNALLRAVCRQIEPLNHVKLDYLSLYRSMPTLSGGEQKRFFLAHLLANDFGSLIYILDEPTTGLHETEKQQLLKTLKRMKRNDNTMIIVEHDEHYIRSAEHIIDIGPLAGSEGGKLIYSGPFADFRQHPHSITAQYLRQKQKGKGTNLSPTPIKRSTPMIKIDAVRTHNLQLRSVRFPIGAMTGIAGVSGSGKSSLIGGTLVPAIANSIEQRKAATRSLDKGNPRPVSQDDPDAEPEALAQYRRLSGHEAIERCIEVTQAAIGRRSNSNPATYLGLWSRIRQLFANTSTATRAGLTAADFSFNSSGACSDCNGNGNRRVWLGNTYMMYQCETCNGQRFRPDILEIQLNGHNVIDILDQSVTTAKLTFKDDRQISRMLSSLIECGLGYLRLGQPTSSLSGGEAQRIKLARELARPVHPQQRKPPRQQERQEKKAAHVLYVFDEPTNGLSQFDVERLMQTLQALRSQGHTIILIEHDAAVLSCCDWIVELGPGSGNNGGKLVCQGPPAKILASEASLIGSFLQPV